MERPPVETLTTLFIASHLAGRPFGVSSISIILRVLPLQLGSASALSFTFGREYILTLCFLMAGSTCLLLLVFTLFLEPLKRFVDRPVCRQATGP